MTSYLISDIIFIEKRNELIIIMIKNGTGGATTKNGLKFQNDPRTFHTHLHSNMQRLETGYELYSLIKEKTGKKYTEYLSKRIIPDECYIDLKNKIFKAYEKKTQSGDGSVDEKLQTCAYKIHILRKACALLNIPPENVTYTYTLDQWFNDVKYKDTLEYIKATPGCDYEILPFKFKG